MPKIGDTYRDHQQKTGQLMNQFKISCLFYSFAFVLSQVSGGKLDPNQISNFTILMPKNLKWAMAKCKYVKTKLQAYELQSRYIISSSQSTAIPRFTLLMWGDIKKPRKAKTA